MSYIDQALQTLKQFEGSIPWMYLDTNGYVTVGVGDMLPNVSAAQKLPFVINGVKATIDQITAEYSRVSSMAKGHLASFYKSALVLTDDGVLGILRNQVSAFEISLIHIYPMYAGFSDNVKEALIDMVFNLGPYKLQHGFPHFTAYINAGNFIAAAGVSHRNGPSEARNDYVKSLLLHA